MSDTVPFMLALGVLLALSGLIALAFGIYALIRVERGRSGGLDASPERNSHVTTGMRVVTGGAIALVLGASVLWLHVSG